MTDVLDNVLEKPLYERDFVLWTEAQAAALRAEAARLRANDTPALDFDNLIEEIESLGRSERWQLTNRLGTVIEHLLKLEFSPASDPRAGWRGTILRSRQDIDELLTTSPSLRREITETAERAGRRAKRRVAEDLRSRGELTSATEGEMHVRTYSDTEMLDEDWFPPQR